MGGSSLNYVLFRPYMNNNHFTFHTIRIGKERGEASMTRQRRKPNPDDRSDNVEKLQEMIHDTYENISEAEESLESASDEQRENIIEKNKRRRRAIAGFRDEIKDEVDH